MAPDDYPRLARRAALAFVIAALAAGVFMYWLNTAVGGDGIGVPLALLMSLALGSLAASIVMLIANFRLSGQLNDLAYAGSGQAVQRVLRGEEATALSANDQAEASRYAALVLRTQPVLLAQAGLLLGGVALSQLALFLNDPADGASLVFLVVPCAMVLVIIVFVPIMFRRRRRLQRYVDEHPVPAGA